MLEELIKAISPKWAFNRAVARHMLEQTAYEVAKPSRFRHMRRETRGPKALTQETAQNLMQQARWYEENYDLVSTMIDVFVTNVIGPNGIGVVPQPKTRDGDIDTELARQISEIREEWAIRPEVTRQSSNAQAEHLAARTWFRDGEVFGQHLIGNIPGLEHSTDIPYSVELIEPEMVPYTDLLTIPGSSSAINQGIVLNSWSKPVAYKVYKQHPGDLFSFRSGLGLQTKEIPAERMIHGFTKKRIGQIRGITNLAPCLPTIIDLRDYEHSERQAAKIAASMTAFIRKAAPMNLTNPVLSGTNSDGSASEYRGLQIGAGMIWDSLQPGDDVGTIQSNRPSTLLQPFRNAMVKTITGAANVGYSATSRNFDGTFASQRQELVEQFPVYVCASSAFISFYTMPCYRNLVSASVLAKKGRLRVNRDIDISTISDAQYLTPAMPWIDPLKEASANLILVQAGIKAREQVVREHGGNPEAVRAAIKKERMQDEQDNLIFSGNWETLARNVLNDVEERESTSEQES